MTDTHNNKQLEKEFSEMVPEYSKNLQKAFALTIKNHLRKWWDDRAGKTGEVPSSVRYDVTAFTFSYSDDDKDEDDTYFRPMASLVDGDGNQVRIPDIKSVDAAEIEHWMKRSEEIQHPIMKARYSDLIWELSELATGNKPDIIFARRAIDAYLKSVENELYKESLYAIHYCERALDLSLSINDGSLRSRCKDVMFSLYDKIADFDKIGLWAFLYDDLMDNPKVDLSKEESNKIISELEKILGEYSEMSGGKYPDPFVAEASAERLAKYYTKSGSTVDVKRVIQKSGIYFEMVSKSASSLLAIGWLERVLNNYDQYRMIEDKKRVLRKMKNRGKNAKSEMKEISVEVKIPQKDISQMVNEVCKGSAKEALTKLITEFMPNTENAKRNCDYIKKDCVLLSLLDTTLIRNGNVEARIGSIEKDETGHIIQHLARDLSTYSGFIALVLDEIKKRAVVSEDDILEFIGNSPFIKETEIDILRQGILAHYNGDYIASVHILTLQCERIIRNIAIAVKVVSTKYKRHDRTTQVRTLYELLADEIFVATVPNDLRLYLQCLLVDKRGLNIRNNVAHGLLTSDCFNEQLSAQIIYCVLLCSILRLETKQE